MGRVLTLLLVVSLLTNGLLFWAYQGAKADSEQASAEAERLQGQIVELNQQLRSSRSERAQPALADPPSEADAPLGQPPPPEVLDALHRIEDTVVSLRGLTPKEDVPIEFLDREQLRQYFQSAFDREYSPEEREQDRKLLSYIGLIPENFDLPDFLVQLLGEQVVGFYDDERKRMALIGEAADLNPDERITFAHEYTHSLQDQHFDLRKLNPPDSDNDDQGLAVSGLIEGDAVLLMGLWASQNLTRRELEEASQSGGDDRLLRDAPLVLRTELLFPYSEGARFVRRLYDQGGYAAVDEAFRDPPQSTEQILHPEKYRQRDEPIRVEIAATDQVLGHGWSDVTANTLGELDLRIFIEQFTDRQTGMRAAAGWGGDRYRLVEASDGRLAFILKTAWDSQNDADEFSSALVQSLRKRFGIGGGASSESRVLVPATSQTSLVVNQGGEVLLVMGPDETTVSQAAAALGR